MLLLTKAAAAWAQLVEESSLSPLHAIARPTELTPDSAATYHHHLQSAARQAELLHGHSHRSLHAVSADAASRRRLTHGTVIDPVAFGADPTGQTDSTPAFNMAMAALLNHTEADRKMASGIVDLGGRTMSLGGGAFLLSSPLKIPEFFGNIHFRDGTLRAAPSFPSAEWLLSVGDVGCWPTLPSGKHDKQGSCNEFISLTNMLLDASDVAAGGVRISKTMGATLTSTFFLGFSQVGLQVNSGHEVMLVDSWLAQCYWSDTSRCQGASSVGVQLNGNDHLLSNVIVFDYATVGVQVNGAANMLSAVHTWNGGGVGIALGSATAPYGAHQNRLLGCYLDYNTLDVYDPTAVIVESTFCVPIWSSNPGLADHRMICDSHLSGAVSGKSSRPTRPCTRYTERWTGW
eukprot:Transcript_338.p2 GENE.Transcript_338~~Transcript_338.p2  ORF type:complete len:403 (-),score=121.45 Transcript_338:909-2117(-)